MRNSGLILGIDPDVEKSGFALLDCETRTFEYLGTLSFPDAVKFLDGLASRETKDITVVIEDSNVSTNWHIDNIQYAPITVLAKIRKAAAMGRSVGKCHATAQHLQEYAESVGLQVRLQKPLQKCWKGADRKITHEELSMFVKGLPRRTNPEVRDACLLSWVTAGFEIRIKVSR